MPYADNFRPYLSKPPKAMKRFVKQSRRIGCHVRKFATEDFRFSLRVNYQPCQFRPGEHPLKCKLRKATLRLGITATDVRDDSHDGYGVGLGGCRFAGPLLSD